MRRAVQIAAGAMVLALVFVALVPAEVEVRVDPVDGNGAVVSGWLASGTARVSLDAQSVPWGGRLRADGLTGRVEADGRVRVRARLFRGPVRVAKLVLVGRRITLEHGPGSLAGRVLAGDDR